ncbi:DnaJ domain-containing protein [Candidatus Nitronereus thalassa]|uniref:DnaJ domain-containing protein n=1 Tax=Candidatus Nitronereus thalassa TaxID=3020898 RepID=A0ABU3KBG0_9BACT|nr:DnaJ domain-containing protein [Candidatus Nitronereus thalassa]MDT7043776.1 DnaJ domain-containing protein [Candidatus Nitronereus thalassa]
MPRIHLDYYVTLEVTPEATDEEIKKSYRKLALKYHPDRNQGDKEAEEKIRELNAAYEILGDPETRKSYERMRFGGFGAKSDHHDEGPDEALDPGEILEGMEKKLWDEGRLEIFRVLMKDIPRVKAALVKIREGTVAVLGYDKFREDIVKHFAKAMIPSLVTEEMEERKERLIDVGLAMMLSQGVDGPGGKQGSDWVRKQLVEAYDRGREDGYCEACELLYTRQ